MTTSTPQEPAGIAPAQAPAKARVGKPRTPNAPSKTKLAPKAKTAAKKAAATRRGSKTAKIIDLLKRPGGATLKELLKATGWQAHSVRGFLSGTLGKKMGTPVKSSKREDGKREYRLSK